MLPFKLLYKLVVYLNRTLVPIILIAISITITLPNAGLHKSTLNSGDFYTKLSSELHGNKLASSDLKNGIWAVVFASIFSDLTTPGWLKNFFEKNIDVSTDWLVGKTDSLQLYIPTKDIELAVTQNIDSQVKDLGSQTKLCSASASESIKTQGYDSNQEFCLPSEVKDGTQTLSQYLALSKNNLENKNNLSSLINSNSLNNLSDKANAVDLAAKNKVFASFYDYLTKIRNSFIFLKNSQPYLIGLVLLMLVVQLVLAGLSGRKVLAEIRRFSFFTILGIVSLSFFFVLSFGLTVYLNSNLATLLFPSLVSSNLVTIISLEVVKFSFNLISVALLVAVALAVLYVLVFLVEKLSIKMKSNRNNSFKRENKFIANPTLDGEFQNILQQQSPTTSIPSIATPDAVTSTGNPSKPIVPGL